MGVAFRWLVIWFLLLLCWGHDFGDLVGILLVLLLGIQNSSESLLAYVIKPSRIRILGLPHLVVLDAFHFRASSVCMTLALG